MRMGRVAYISTDPGVPIFGRKGCSIHAQEVLGAMLRAGARVDLFSTSAEGEPPPELRSLGLHRLPPPPRGDAAAREKAALAANQALLAELKGAPPYDFIYERYSLWSYAAMEFARDAGLPGLLEVNAPLIEEQARYRVLVDRPAAEEAARRTFAAASCLLAVSDEVAGWLNQFAGAQGKVQVVSNGVRPERFPDALEPALPAPTGVFTVGFVGTLKSWHGLPILVDAFARLHSRRSHTRLLIVGDGPERPNLEADISARSLQGSSLLTGAVSLEQVPALLASMDAAAAPYPALESFYFSPLKVYEYMAAGLGVVASRIGQLQQLIQPEINGLLVEPGNPAALACALERLHDEPVLCARLGSAARAAVLRHHTWDAVVRRIFGLAESCARQCCQTLSSNGDQGLQPLTSDLQL